MHLKFGSGSLVFVLESVILLKECYNSNLRIMINEKFIKKIIKKWKCRKFNLKKVENFNHCFFFFAAVLKLILALPAEFMSFKCSVTFSRVVVQNFTEAWLLQPNQVIQ